MAQTKKLFGKYRGTVVNTVDPDGLGRIQALVPDVSPRPLGWALPCAPVAGNQMGIRAVPAIAANVWIEFERGDPDFPIWSGGFWTSAGEMRHPVYLGLRRDKKAEDVVRERESSRDQTS